jgi:hypothetical protein
VLLLGACQTIQARLAPEKHTGTVHTIGQMNQPSAPSARLTAIRNLQGSRRSVIPPRICIAGPLYWTREKE